MIQYFNENKKILFPNYNLIQTKICIHMCEGMWFIMPHILSFAEKGGTKCSSSFKCK